MRQEIRALAARQHGVFSTWQLDGTPDAVVMRAARAGELERLLPDTYRFLGAPQTWEQCVVAAVLSCGPDAAASHMTAAHVWGMTDRLPETIEVSTPRGRIRRRGFLVHHSRDLVDGHRRCHDGIVVTTPARCVLDVAGPHGLGSAARTFDAALRLGLVDAAGVGELVEDVARSGRPGIRATRLLVGERMGWRGRSQSQLEDRFRTLVTRAGLPQPEAQYRVHDDNGNVIARVDYAYPPAKLAIELDGWSFHSGVEEFRRDRTRQNRLVALGWTVLRFTWWDLDVGAKQSLGILGALTRNRCV